MVCKAEGSLNLCLGIFKSSAKKYNYGKKEVYLFLNLSHSKVGDVFCSHLPMQESFYWVETKHGQFQPEMITFWKILMNEHSHIEVWVLLPGSITLPS